MTVHLTLDQVRDLSMRALRACNTSDENARPVAASIVAAEADGIHSHGLARLPTYCEHARCGKIDGNASPVCSHVVAGLVKADAAGGFAHPAIDLGLKSLIPAAAQNGIAALAVTNSYNCGVVGYHVERIARGGLVGLGFVNAPRSIAPVGGRKPVFGTNPIACAVPRGKLPPLVVDQSSSVVAKSEIVVHAQKGEPIPEGWALDAEGRPTTDPQAALQGGTMVPSGGYKGAGLALIVEVLAAGLTGANFAYQASSFADNEGGSPRTGQFFIAIDPGPLLHGEFCERIEGLLQEITGQPDARLPGERRLDARQQTATGGITIQKALHERLLGYCLPDV